MVLVVQPDIVSENIERAVVRVCLRGRQGIERVRGLGLLVLLQLGQGLCAAALHVREKVVLCDEVACAGVQGSGEE